MDNVPFILLNGKVCAAYFFPEWKQIERRVHGDKDGSRDTVVSWQRWCSRTPPLFSALSHCLLTVCWQFWVNTNNRLAGLSNHLAATCAHWTVFSSPDEKIVAQTLITFRFPLVLPLLISSVSIPAFKSHRMRRIFLVWNYLLLWKGGWTLWRSTCFLGKTWTSIA